MPGGVPPGMPRLNWETITSKVPFEMRRLRLAGEWFNLYRRRTWTPDEKHWVTDYGVELFGLTVWLHLPGACDPDSCCAQKHNPV